MPIEHTIHTTSPKLTTRRPKLAGPVRARPRPRLDLNNLGMLVKINQNEEPVAMNRAKRRKVTRQLAKIEAKYKQRRS